MPLETIGGSAVATLAGAIKAAAGQSTGFYDAMQGAAAGATAKAQAYRRSARPGVLQPLAGTLPGGGIQESPTSGAPVSVGPGNSVSSVLIAAKPFLSSIFDAALGGGSQSGTPPYAAPVGTAALPSEPWTNPQGQPADWPEWDWETWDRENPNWGGTTSTTEDEDMAVDWGGLANIGIDFLQGQTGQQFSAPVYSGPGVLGGDNGLPAQVTVDTRTGKVRPCRRRRRRRLLTPTDLSDLAALSAIVGKGDALKLAVAKAVRR